MEDHTGHPAIDYYTAGSPPETADAVIIMCHGFGAQGRDLMDLADYLDTHAAHHWIFPQAPHSLPETGGFAWFPRNPADLRRALYGSYFSNTAELSDPGLDESAEEILSLLESVQSGGAKSRPIVLGGFSQGSMVALRAGLRARSPVKDLVAGIVLFSSALIDKDTTGSLLSETRPFPVFQSHGTWDPVLSLTSARELHELLLSAGLADLLTFEGGHEIPLHIVQQAGVFIEKCIGAK